MSIFTPHVVLAIGQHTIDATASRRASVKRLVLPPSVVSHLEVRDRNAYLRTIEDALQHFTQKNAEATILLSSNIVFSKILPREASPQAQKAFFDLVPIHDGDVVRRAVLYESNLYLFAANRTLYEPLLEEVQSRGWRPKAVIACGVLPGVDCVSETSDGMFRVLQAKQELRRAVNLLETTGS